MKYNALLTNPMPPEWLMYPHIPNGSIGWRMGYGEGYAYELHEWLKSLSDMEKRMYNEMFPRPKIWHRAYMSSGVSFWNFGGKPEYSLDNLLFDYNYDKDLEFIFFWGHTSASEHIGKACLSQWWKSDFQVSINKYCCMEQYMMAEKARLFKDTEIEKQILKESDPKEIKALGRCVKNFDETIWDKHKYSIALNGNYYKFIQNKESFDYILSTQGKILVEASPYDGIWGVQMSADDKDVYNPKLWKGENLLGFALMEVRNELARVCKNIDKIDWAVFS